MDPLTHIFLPLTVLYVVRPAFFQFPHRFAVAGLGIFADFDKLLGVPGLFHSLLTLILIVFLLSVLEWLTQRRLVVTTVAGAFLVSHLLLDIIDGGPAPLLYPVHTTGLGLYYPAQIVFGEGALGFTIEGPLLTLHNAAPRPGFNSYGFLNGFGVASTLTFLIIYLCENTASDIGDSSFYS